MGKSKRVSWSTKGGDQDAYETRREILDAYLGEVASMVRLKDRKEIESLNQVVQGLSGLVVPLDRSQKLEEALQQMVDFATHGRAERSNLKVEDVYTVRYGRGTRGTASIRLTNRIVRRRFKEEPRRISFGKSTVSSRNFPLLLGETYQQAARAILESMTVEGHRVIDVRPLKSETKHGRRIDDWSVALSNDGKIPAEVKGTTRAGYFKSAFE